MKLYREDKEFWDTLKDIKHRAVHCEHRYSGAYSEITYTMPDGTKYLYTEDDDLGVAYSLENLS